MGLYDFTFYDVILRNAASFGEQLAWFEADDSRTLTFAQYKDSVDRLAVGLQQNNIKQGDRIGILGKNSLEFFLLYGATAAVGAILLPINWRLSAEEMVFNLNDCAPKILFVDAEYQGLINDSKSRLSSVKTYFNLKPPGGAFEDFDALLANSGEWEAADLAMDDGFVIIHTAAVAGRPRGALLSHRNLISSNIHLNFLFDQPRGDAHLNLLPMFHVAGLSMIIAAFHAGIPSVNMSKFDAGQAAALIEKKKISILYDFPPILASILEAAEQSGNDITSLKRVTGLEAPDMIEKYQQLTGGTFYCLYGQTETSALATIGIYNDRPGSAGKTILLADVRLVDEDDKTVAAGETGEIVMKGPMVFNGYWNLPEDTAYTLRGGWLHTGDLGRFDEDGYLWYEGRKAEKELIKPGGENVYPAEVEKVILEHPAVAGTVVFGVPDPKWKEGIKAVCQLSSGQTLVAQELIQFVGERIARYKKPQYVEFVSELPLLKDGTPDRAKVKELFGGSQS